MNTLVLKLPLEDAEQSLDLRLKELCDVRYAAGYRLTAMCLIGTDLLLVFQKP